jgi:hypothetical protein
MTARGLVFAVAALALVAGGCGSNSVGKRLSKAEFVSRADAICAKYEKRVQTRMAGVPAGDQKQLANSIGKVIPVIRKGNDELRSLRPPASLQGRFDRWMGIADAEVNAAHKLQVALSKNNLGTIQAAFKELQTKDTAQDRIARRDLGLTGCASGSSR